MFADALEFLVTSSETSQQWSACLWDFNSESGNTLQIYRNGGVATNNTLQQIGNDYFVTAEQSKPLLHIWPVNSQEQIKNVRLVLPEPASALAVSPDNCYMAIGIGSKLYVWHVSSGKLLTIQHKHLLAITCIKFSANADFLLTTCQAGMVVAYNFGTLICLHNNQLAQSEIGQVEPMYCRVDHTGAINDLHIGQFGVKSRFATVSDDHTCRLYELLTGQPLLQLIYDEYLTSVILNASCWHLFIGAKSGKIQQFNLQNPPRTMSVHVDTNTPNRLNFIGHKSRITCLDLNVTNKILASGSDDFTVIVWNVQSRQMLNKIEHRAPVTNARFVMRNENLFAQNFKQRCLVSSFERNVNVDPSKFVVSVVQEEDIVFSDEEEVKAIAVSTEGKEDLKEEIEKLKGINRELYISLMQFNEKYNG